MSCLSALNTFPITKFDFIAVHGPCADGETCEIIARLHGSQEIPDNIPCYKLEPGAAVGNTVDCANKSIVFMDTVPDDLEEILKVATLVRVIDHHETPNQKLLEELRHKYTNLQVVFEIGKCAAELVWQYYCPNSPQPWIIDVVGAHDCWRWDTCERHLEPLWMYLFEDQQFNIEKYNTFMALDSIEMKEAIDKGTKLLEQRDLDIQEIVKQAKLVTLFGQTCYILHKSDTKYNSKIGEYLAKKEEAQFSMIYKYSEISKCWKSSLRSYKDKFDVSVYAYSVTTQYSQYFVKVGGGHRTASGISWLIDPMTLSKLKS